MSATKIGVLYSAATGVILRTINPDNIMGDAHLDWLEVNKPEGTVLLTLLKSDVGADEKNCPHLKQLIPHIEQNHGIKLNFGVSCSILDETNMVIGNTVACPVLLQKSFDKHLTLNPTSQESRKVLTFTGEVGSVYNETTKLFEKPKNPVVVNKSIIPKVVHE